MDEIFLTRLVLVGAGEGEGAPVEGDAQQELLLGGAQLLPHGHGGVLRENKMT